MKQRWCRTAIPEPRDTERCRVVQAPQLHPPEHTHLTEHPQTIGPDLVTLWCTLRQGWRHQTCSRRGSRCQHQEAPVAAWPCPDWRSTVTSFIPQLLPAGPPGLLCSSKSAWSLWNNLRKAAHSSLAGLGCEGGRENTAELRQSKSLRGRGASLPQSAYSSPGAQSTQQEHRELQMDLWQALSTLEGLNTPKGSSASAKPQHCNSPGHRQRHTLTPGR